MTTFHEIYTFIHLSHKKAIDIDRANIVSSFSSTPPLLPHHWPSTSSRLKRERDAILNRWPIASLSKRGHETFFAVITWTRTTLRGPVTDVQANYTGNVYGKSEPSVPRLCSPSPGNTRPVRQIDGSGFYFSSTFDVDRGGFAEN